MKLAIVCSWALLGFNLAAQPPNGSFVVSQPMKTPRTAHTATLLPSGQVLIAGGYAILAGLPVWSSAELYDPAYGAFRPTGIMNSARYSHTATLLPDGRVLIVGGNSQQGGTNYQGLATAELYDPSTGVFTPTGSMAIARYWHTATLLNTGKVLITGGLGPGGVFGSDLSSAELYDPETGVFSPAGNMTGPRSEHLAVLLPDGKVLIEGGTDPIPNPELYDPVAGTFASTGPSTQASYLSAMTATLLPDGSVYTTMNDPGDVGNGAESYDPVTGTFTPATLLPDDMYSDTATLLPQGLIFIHGAETNNGVYPYQAGGSSWLYDSATRAYVFLTGAFPESDESHTSTLLPDGAVLLAGGWICCGFSVANSEIYLPAAPVKSAILYTTSGGTQGAILHGATQQPVSAASPAVAGETIEIFGAGLVGGSAIPPQVWIGGRGAPVTFFGDAPGYPGLNQINVVVPCGVASGSAPVRLDYLSRPSNTVMAAIQ